MSTMRFQCDLWYQNSQDATPVDINVKKKSYKTFLGNKLGADGLTIALFSNLTFNVKIFMLWQMQNLS